MKNENKKKSWVDIILDDNHKPFLFSIGFGILLILYFLVPFYKTSSEKEIYLISGFASFSYLQDRYDYLYYATMMNILSLTFSGFLIVSGLVGFSKEEKQVQRAKAFILIFFILKILSDILMLVFSFLTKTNVTSSLGSEMEIVFDVLFFILTILIIKPIKSKKTK